MYKTKSWTFRTTYFGLSKDHLGRISQWIALASQRGTRVLPYLQRQLSQSRRTVLSDKQKVKQAWQKATTDNHGTPGLSLNTQKKTMQRWKWGWTGPKGQSKHAGTVQKAKAQLELKLIRNVKDLFKYTGSKRKHGLKKTKHGFTVQQCRQPGDKGCTSYFEDDVLYTFSACFHR